MAFQTDRIQVDGSINIDGSIFQYGVEFTGGGGGTGDVAWASGNDGSADQIITANGDGSIVAESTLLFSSNTLYARDTFGVSGPEDLIIRAGDATSSGAGGHLSLRGGNANSNAAGGDVSINGGAGAGGLDGGNLFLVSGYAPGGKAGILQLLGANSGGSAGGAIRIIAGNSPGSAGSVTIKGGSASVGGDVSINGGVGTASSAGKIYIGQTDTSALYIGTTSNISTGTPGTNQILYVDTADGNKLKRGSVTTDISTLSIESYVDSSSYYDASLMYRIYPDPSSFSGYSSQGIYVRLTAGGTIYSRQGVIINSTGRMQAADPDSSSLMPAIGINASETTWFSGNEYDVLLYGVFHSSGAFASGPGKQVYLTNTGYLTTTAPTSAPDCVQVMGISISPYSMIVNPSLDFIVLK